MQINICYSRSAIAGLLLASAPIAASCALGGPWPSDLDLVCSGNSYTKGGDPFPTTETISFLKEGKKLAISGFPDSDQPTKGKIISSNQIQLKFAAGSLTGEYFNFTGDLFLIHRDGGFTRLVCKPKA